MTVLDIVNVAFRVYFYMVIARVLISWVPHNPSQPLIRFLYEATEPLLAPCRRLIPPISGIDFSPIIALFVVQAIWWIVIDLLSKLLTKLL